MRLRAKVLLLATVPLMLAILGVVWVVMVQSDLLARAQIAAIEPVLVQARKDELKHFVQVGGRAIAHLYQDGNRDPARQHEAKEILRRMDFGADNYFYIYDLRGFSVMHPRLPEFEGTDRWSQVDGTGSLIVQRLILRARYGGGFFDFTWLRPSTGKVEPKVGYVELVPAWGWVIGSGLYLDELNEAKRLIRASTHAAVRTTHDQILMIALAALLAVGVGGFAMNLLEQRTADGKLRAMARQLVLSQEAERTRVARDLHDGVIQWMAAVKFVFESALVHMERGSSEAASTLRNGLQQMRGVIRDVRKISHDLRPTLLDDEGLAKAIEHIALEFGDRTGVEVDIQVGVLPKMADAVATAVFRVVQEALGNTERHAGASHIWLNLQHDSNGLELRLRDNGHGFNVPALLRKTREGLGLTNMRERIEMLGGRFELRSAPGETILTARLPTIALES